MPYLEVSKQEEIKKVVEMPNVEGLTITEAKKILKELTLEVEIDTDNTENIIINQIPKKGIQINEGTKVILYTK